MFTLLQRPQDETRMPPSPFLTLPHTRLIFSATYNPYAPAGPLKLCLRHHPHPPYASLHPPNPLHHLPPSRSHSALLTCLQRRLPPLGSRSDLPTFLQRFLPSLGSRSSLPTCLQPHLPSLHSHSALPICL
ncbi:hypothetical protein O181_010084 [Austropuccinia psidii MF-1]|uniref:Uncharacterized protein n=1 Tax=Austropuccinia psidii MF-1 TaxID=1389203 RepID=A0A9Q3BQD5_9BASI|nr:hypothetical protein [Austropuccinia psidii MF-1]